MREIKFRAWVKKEDWEDDDVKPKMVYDIERTYDSGEEGEGSFGTFLAQPERYEIMQYTGLKDKNGKEIYEGDILEGGKYNYVVEWNEFRAEYFLVCEEGIAYITGNFPDGLELGYFVIGNVYEHPELLKNV